MLVECAPSSTGKAIYKKFGKEIKSQRWFGFVSITSMLLAN